MMPPLLYVETEASISSWSTLDVVKRAIDTQRPRTLGVAWVDVEVHCLLPEHVDKARVSGAWVEAIMAELDAAHVLRRDRVRSLGISTISDKARVTCEMSVWAIPAERGWSGN